MAYKKDNAFDRSARELAIGAKSFSHPARVAILRRLGSVKGCNCGGFVEELPLAQATISQHLAVLVSTGFITRTTQGAMSCYSVDREAIRHFVDLIDDFLKEIEKKGAKQGCC